MMTTLRVDASAVAGQTRIVEAITRRYLPLFEKVPRERIEEIISNLVIELRGLIFSYKVTTVTADGSRETVRALRYRGDIKDFTTAFWARELNF
ncbi:hypothetical protein RRQ98_004522 [Klebsiella pneumoniae]|nr:hypothetical protein [Klebsiella pneumoniae]